MFPESKSLFFKRDKLIVAYISGKVSRNPFKIVVWFERKDTIMLTLTLITIGTSCFPGGKALKENVLPYKL